MLNTWKKQLRELKIKLKEKKKVPQSHMRRVMKVEGLIKGYETCDKQWKETMEILRDKETMKVINKYKQTQKGD